nr:MAG TPA: hypothetical protein [Caudoviricetes sp.]
MWPQLIKRENIKPWRNLAFFRGLIRYNTRSVFRRGQCQL